MRAAEDGEISDHYGANPPTTNQGIDMNKIFLTLFILASACDPGPPPTRTSILTNWINEQAEDLTCIWNHKWEACFCTARNRQVPLMIAPDKFCSQ